ncbi:unnamed protein product [Prunus armeniaca]
MPLHNHSQRQFPRSGHQHPMPTLGLLRGRHPDYDVPPLPSRQTVRLHPPPLIGALRPRQTVQMGELLIARLPCTRYAEGRYVPKSVIQKFGLNCLGA